MITPPYLKQGDKIGICASARKISREEIAPAMETLKSWGLEVVVGRHVYKESNQFAGVDNERAEDLQEMFDDSSIKAIIFARGGYGTIRIVDLLNFDNFKKSPKWICGYSDITVLHNHINNLNIETLHSVMLSGFGAEGGESAVETLRKSLFGEELKYSFSTDKKDLQKEGKAEGELVGGNLSLIYALTGSVSDLNTDGKILFLEDLDEYLYHIDRMMLNLKRSGKLKNLKGLLIGGMTEMKDNTIPFGKTAEEIVAESVAEYSYPVAYDLPAGHLKDNRALILGRKVALKVEKSQANLTF